MKNYVIKTQNHFSHLFFGYICFSKVLKLSNKTIYVYRVHLYQKIFNNLYIQIKECKGDLYINLITFTLHRHTEKIVMLLIKNCCLELILSSPQWISHEVYEFLIVFCLPYLLHQFLTLCAIETTIY